jgi:hypothetical protein
MSVGDFPVWPTWARALSHDEKVTYRGWERTCQQYEQLQADVILLISALQQIQYHTTDAHAATCAQIALADYEAARKQVEQ